jgi:polysaccharide biosynthesis/export protein
MKTRFFLAVTASILFSALPVCAQYAGPAPEKSDYARRVLPVTAEQKELDALLDSKLPTVRIASGDMIEVKIYNLKAYEVKTRVAVDGTAIFPLVGSLQVGGLSVEELENLLRDKLQQGGMIRDPHVSAVLSETPTQVATVSGEVMKPGNYPVRGRHTLIEMLSAAEGMKDTASHTVVLDRPGLPEGIPIQLGPDPTQSRYANIPIFAGDTIIVSRVGMFYVVGAVKNAGAYPLKATTPTTVLQAMSMAGGMGYEAELGNARLIRREGTSNRTETRMDLNKIMKGKGEDLTLQADDILMLPTNKMRAAIKGGGAGMAVSLATSFILYH